MLCFSKTTGRHFFLSLCFLVSGIASLASGYSYMSVEKWNEDTLVLKSNFHSILIENNNTFEKFMENTFVLGRFAMGLYSEDTDSMVYFDYDSIEHRILYKEARLKTMNISFIKYLRFDDPKLEYYMALDSFNAFTDCGFGGSIMEALHSPFDQQYFHSRMAGLHDIACKVYPSKLKAVKHTSRVKVDNRRSYRYVDAFYLSNGIYTEDGEDSLSFSLSEPLFKHFKPLRFEKEFGGTILVFVKPPNYQYPDTWKAGYSYQKPYDFLCNPAHDCSQWDTSSYPPKGLFLDSITGDMVFYPRRTKSDTFRYVLLTQKVEQYGLDTQGIYQMYCKGYYTFLITPPLYEDFFSLDIAPRMIYPQSVYYACPGDTLHIPLQSTLPKLGGLRRNFWHWNEGLPNASFEQLSWPKFNSSAEFKWVPTEDDIQRQPHRFTAFLSLDTIMTNVTGRRAYNPSSHTNSKTFLIHVLPKQKSHLVLDSISCGEVFAHAEDTFSLPGKWTYTWRLYQDGILMQEQKGKQVVLITPDSGSYELEMIADPELGSCPVLRRTDVYIPAFTVKKFELPEQGCKEDAFSIQWLATGEDGLMNSQWLSNGRSSDSLSMNGIYGLDSMIHFLAKDTFGCTIQDSFHVAYFNLPKVNLGKDTILCPAEELTVRSNQSFHEMRWNGAIGTDSFIAVAPAEVVLDVKDSLGCQSSDTLTIQAFQTPIPQLDLKKPCLRDTVRVRFPVRDSLNFNSWVLEGVESNGELVFTADTVNHIGYSFTLDTLGKVCSYSQVDTLESYLLPVFHILAPDTLCASSIPLGFKTTSAVPLNWEEDSIFNPVHAFEKGKLFYTSSIRATAKSVEGCEYRDTSWIQVEYPDTLLFTSWEDRLCPPLNEISLPSTTLHGQGVQYFTNGSGRFEFGKYIPSSSDEALDTLYFTFNNENAKSCKAYNGERHVEIGPLVRLEDLELIDPKCEVYTIQLKADNTSNRKTSWRIDGEEVHQNQELNIDLERGTYQLELWQEEEFCRDSVQSTFTVLDTPDVEVFVLPDELFLKDPVAKLEAIGGGSLTYNWTVTNGFESVENPVLVRFSDTGLYEVGLTAVSEQGCTTKVHDQIRVWEKAVHYIPSAFTPDGDGLNDFFKPSTIGYDRYILEVYNRWGELLFVEKNNGKGWNGMANGEPAPEGIYVYTIKLIQSNGEVLEDSGRVALLRGEQ
jgi:gliding motility-associated-like protein